MKRRHFNQAMYLICLVYLILPLNIYAQARPIKKTPGVAIFVMAETPAITAVTRHLKEDRDIIYLDMKVPELKGLTDKSFQKKLNKRFMEEGLSKRKEVLEAASSYNEEALKDGLTPLRFEYLSSYTIIDTPMPYFVIEILDYQYSGGAHGISYQSYRVLDVNQNKEVHLQDLFKDQTAYKEVINSNIKAQIAERTKKGNYFFTGEDGFNGIKDTQQFYINKNGDIVIVFNLYEIAPYAAGVIEFIIPKQTLAPYFK